MLFRRAARLMARAHHGGERGHRGHHAQRHVLSLLLEKGPLPQSELLEILDVRSSSLSEILGKLERNDLITRERNESDRRSFIVKATELARKTLGDQGIPNGTAPLFACLNAEEQDQLRAILQKLIDSAQEAPLCDKPAFERGGPGRGRPGKGRGQGRGEGRGKGRGKGKGGRRG
ncbi:MarR family transcriptional regulator [Pseudodesulfovibrio cashew]|uniref:MarR family transcriptional regulator n=2 Tax=Pseudodesulfovibrio cashew TaxID=2678688 RepID=A0A6I6JL77_9BACT|nr:MarR family transcriptional regulator [Pseudodesulfovibrio cashew]